MIDKEDLLNNKDFYKSFRNGEDLTSFFQELHEKAGEHMLDAELDGHLDNEKHIKTTNRFSPKSFGMQIRHPESPLSITVILQSSAGGIAPARQKAFAIATMF